jgi:deoxyadenosine/deoxycytidine kinase
MMMPTGNRKLTPVEQEVTQHFVYLHGALQVLEQRLIERMRCAKMEAKQSLNSVENELNSHIQHVRQLLQEAVAAKAPDNIGRVELSSFTDKLRAVEQLPMHLVASDINNADTSVR